MTVLLNPSQFNGVARELTRGITVDRATDTLPATTDEALFRITGGRILLVDLVGEVTTVIQTQANNTKLKFNPTATGADVDLCAVLDITADAVGTLYSLTGTVGDAMTSRLLCLSAADLLARPIVLSEGDIELDCAATNTGSVAWSAVYVPLDSGAELAAV
jgi:hypothetical protein